MMKFLLFLFVPFSILSSIEKTPKQARKLPIVADPLREIRLNCLTSCGCEDIKGDFSKPKESIEAALQQNKSYLRYYGFQHIMSYLRFMPKILSPLSFKPAMIIQEINERSIKVDGNDITILGTNPKSDPTEMPFFAESVSAQAENPINKICEMAADQRMKNFKSRVAFNEGKSVMERDNRMNRDTEIQLCKDEMLKRIGEVEKISAENKENQPKLKDAGIAIEIKALYKDKDTKERERSFIFILLSILIKEDNGDGNPLFVIETWAGELEGGFQEGMKISANPKSPFLPTIMQGMEKVEVGLHKINDGFLEHHKEEFKKMCTLTYVSAKKGLMLAFNGLLHHEEISPVDNHVVCPIKMDRLEDIFANIEDKNLISLLLSGYVKNLFKEWSIESLGINEIVSQSGNMEAARPTRSVKSFCNRKRIEKEETEDIDLPWNCTELNNVFTLLNMESNLVMDILGLVLTSTKDDVLVLGEDENNCKMNIRDFVIDIKFTQQASFKCAEFTYKSHFLDNEKLFCEENLSKRFNILMGEQKKTNYQLYEYFYNPILQNLHEFYSDLNIINQDYLNIMYFYEAYVGLYYNSMLGDHLNTFITDKVKYQFEFRSRVFFKMFSDEVKEISDSFTKTDEFILARFLVYEKGVDIIEDDNLALKLKQIVMEISDTGTFVNIFFTTGHSTFQTSMARSSLEFEENTFSESIIRFLDKKEIFKEFNEFLEDTMGNSAILKTGSLTEQILHLVSTKFMNFPIVLAIFNYVILDYRKGDETVYDKLRNKGGMGLEDDEMSTDEDAVVAEVRFSSNNFQNEYIKYMESILDVTKKGSERETWIYMNDEEDTKEKLGPLMSTINAGDIVTDYETADIVEEDHVFAEIKFALERLLKTEGQSMRYAFGDKVCKHILTAELFYSPIEPMRSLHVKFTTFYFNVEYIIGLSTPLDLMVHLHNIIEEVTIHHNRFVETLKETSGQVSVIDIKAIDELLYQVTLEKKSQDALGGTKRICKCEQEGGNGYCIEEGSQDGSVPECATKEGLDVFIKVTNFTDGEFGEAFNFEIKENKHYSDDIKGGDNLQDIKTQKHSRGFVTNYKIYKNNTFDEKPLLMSFLEKALYHYMLGSFLGEKPTD